MLGVKRTAEINSSTTERARGRNHLAVSKPAENGGEGVNHQARVAAVSPNNATRIPVITGEAHFQGLMPVNGMLAGKLGGNGGSVDVRQKLNHVRQTEPELSGQLSFVDLVRINGHIAGTVYSQRGTLIVDSEAAVDANVNVGIAVIKGTVNGDIVAQQRVELAPGSKVFGNIWTRSIAIAVGAVFDGECNMLTDP